MRLLFVLVAAAVAAATATRLTCECAASPGALQLVVQVAAPVPVAVWVEQVQRVVAECAAAPQCFSHAALNAAQPFALFMTVLGELPDGGLAGELRLMAQQPVTLNCTRDCSSEPGIIRLKAANTINVFTTVLPAIPRIPGWP